MSLVDTTENMNETDVSDVDFFQYVDSLLNEYGLFSSANYNDWVDYFIKQYYDEVVKIHESFVFESNAPLRYLHYFILYILVPLILAFGCISNIINLIIFYRQGLLADACIPTFVMMSVSDFCFSFLRFSGDLIASPFRLVEVRLEDVSALNYLSVINDVLRGISKGFVHYTLWLTVYLAFERMMCVTFPFKVKHILTPRRSYVVTIVMLVLIIIVHSPTMVQKGVDVSYSLVNISIVLNFGILRPLSIVLIIIFNVVTTIQLVKVKRFKQTAVTARGDESGGIANATEKKREATRKESKIIRLMIVLSVVSVVCYTQGVVLNTMIDFVKIRNINPHVHYLLNMASDFMESISSNVNIFIYKSMSKRYNIEFIKVFKRFNYKQSFCV